MNSFTKGENHDFSATIFSAAKPQCYLSYEKLNAGWDCPSEFEQFLLVISLVLKKNKTKIELHYICDVQIWLFPIYKQVIQGHSG